MLLMEPARPHCLQRHVAYLPELPLQFCPPEAPFCGRLVDWLASCSGCCDRICRSTVQHVRTIDRWRGSEAGCWSCELRLRNAQQIPYNMVIVSQPQRICFGERNSTLTERRWVCSAPSRAAAHTGCEELE